MIQLREYAERDIPLLVEYLNNSSVTKFLSSRIPQPYTIDNAHWWVSEGSKEGIVRAIEFNNIFVGTIGAQPGVFEHERSAEIGYWLAEPYWGKGIGTHALRMLTNEIFQITELVRLFAPVFQDNEASMRVLEKCGYRREGLLEKAAYKNGKYFNVAIYGSIKS